MKKKFKRGVSVWKFPKTDLLNLKTLVILPFKKIKKL